VGQVLTQLALPLFIFDIHGASLNVFSSLENAQAYYETEEVLDGEYYGFDSQGQPLRFLALDHVRVSIEAADRPTQPEALEQSLRAYLKVVDARAQGPACDLSCLMAMATERYSYTHDPHPIFHFLRDGFRELFRFIHNRLINNKK